MDGKKEEGREEEGLGYGKVMRRMKKGRRKEGREIRRRKGKRKGGKDNIAGNLTVINFF